MKRERDEDDESNASDGSEENSENEDEVEELDSDTRIGRVSKALRQLESPGSFNTSGSYTVFPLPVINVDRAGPVFLSLADAAAKELIAQCHLAPYGLGEQTLVDTSVRNTWELNTTQFKIDNPAWQPFVDGILEASRLPLGLPASANVTAKPYKLLLYEAGGKFERHQDTEKEDGMFGTLVVVLPGVFTGGELIVHEPSKVTVSDSAATEAAATKEEEAAPTTNKTLSTTAVQPFVWDAGSMDPFAVKYAAFYGDCPHEVLPVKSGYRLCLTYNLVFDSNDDTPPAALSVEQNNAVYSSLCEYFADDSTSDTKRQKTGPDTASPSPTSCFDVSNAATHRATKLVYILNHEYTKSSLSLKYLKNKDALVASNLVAFCYASRGVFELYLCKLGYHWEWHGNDHEEFHGDEDDLGEDEYINDILSLNHCWVPCSYEGDVIEVEGSENENILIESYAEVVAHFTLSKAARDERFIPYTGNEGSKQVKSYSSAALVLIPTHERLKMQMTQSPIDAVLHGWLPLLDTNRSAARQFIRTFGTVDQEYMEKQDLSPAQARRLLEGAGRRGELPSVGVLLQLWSSVPYVAGLPAVMATFAWEDVVAMMEEVVKYLPAAGRSRSVVNLFCSCVSATTEADKIEQLLNVAELEGDTEEDGEEDWEAVSYARLLAIVVGGAPEQLGSVLWASTKERLTTVVSPALRQVLNGSVPDSVRTAVTNLRDVLAASEAGDEVQQEIKELDALLQLE